MYIGIVQPANVCWFKSFKNRYTQNQENWFHNKPKVYTRYSNMADPGYENISDWITIIWLEIDTDLVKKSFKYCCIVTNDISLLIKT